MLVAGEASHIDKSGRWVIRLHSGGGFGFSEGLAAVSYKTEQGNKLGYINHAGRVVIEPKFDRAFAFSGGVAEVYLEKIIQAAPGRLLAARRGYIDRTGRYLWEPRWGQTTTR